MQVVQVEHVKRLIDNFVQVFIFISPQVAAIVHSNYWHVALASTLGTGLITGTINCEYCDSGRNRNT